jgi:hypothetical protein
MKSFPIVLAFSCLLALGSQAQLPDALSKATGTANPASLLTQFSSAIKPSSFLPSWASGGKADWLAAAGKVKDAAGMATQASSLAGFIKPTMFKDGFNVASITQAANAAKTYADASGVLKSLEGGLKPEALVESWASKRSSWLSALKLLK